MSSSLASIARNIAPTHSAPSTRPAQHRRPRDPYLDNARYGVMLLVVAGHFLAQLLGTEDVRGAYLWIYLFHMPVFVLISGYTARTYTGEPRQIRRLLGTLVIPYLLVEGGLEITEQRLAGEPVTLHVLEPDWLTWFIAALFVWRLTTPIWHAIRWPLPVAICCSLVGGLSPVGDVLAIPQIIGLLPFYVAGLLVRREHFDRLAAWQVRAGALVALAIAAVVCVRENADWMLSWVYWRDGYSDAPLHAPPLDGLLNRGMLLVLGFVLAAAVLALVPRRRMWFSAMGERTLYCYLLHGFVVLWLTHEGAFEYMAKRDTIGAAMMALGGVLLAMLLMTKPVAYVMRPVFEPRLTWLVPERQSR